MVSTYGVKLNDGSTWYRVTVSSNGSARDLWLKYESSKMTVKDLTNSTPAPQPEPATIEFSTPSVVLDLSKNSSQTVTLTISGDLPSNCELQVSMSKGDVAGVHWGSTPIERVSQPLIIGKAAGETTLTCAVVDGNTKEILAQADLKIIVTVPTYSVKYDANGGQNAPADQTKEYQKTLTLTNSYPTREGYTFSGWSTSSNGLVQYQPGGQYTADQNVTLYAVWRANSYTVYYDANGGSGAPAAQTKLHQNDLTLSNIQPTRDGSSFAGWATSANGPVQYRLGQQYTMDQNVILYAVWVAQNDVSLTLERSSFGVEAGDQFTLNFSYTGEVEKVTYDIGNENICIFDHTSSVSKQNGATVISVVFKTRSAGTTSIAINLLDEKGDVVVSKTASVTVDDRTVPPVPLGSYEYNLGGSSLNVGGSFDIWVKDSYSDGTIKDVTSSCSVSSSDASVLAVNGYTITALKAGTAQVFLTLPEGLTVSKTISVFAAEAQASIDLSESSIVFGSPGESQKIYTTTIPDGLNISWSKEIIDSLPIPDVSPSVFTMYNTSGAENTIRATGCGIAELTATATYEGNEYTASCTVMVPGIYVSAPNTVVSKGGPQRNMYVGETEQLSAYTIPSGQNVSWSSSNTDVATVSSSGKVTAVGSGFAEIKSMFQYNGNVYMSSCYVAVAEQANDPISAKQTYGGEVLSAWGETINIYVVSSGEWSATCDSSWLTFHKTEGTSMSSTSTAEVVVLHANMREELYTEGMDSSNIPERTAAITFRCGDAQTTVYITQMGYRK